MKPFLFTAFLTFTCCSLPSRPPPLVTSLRFTPSAFDPFKRNVELRYSIDREAVVSAYVIKKDSAGHRLVVKTLFEYAEITEGSHAHAWLGGNDAGFFVPTGVYYGVIQTSDDLYETSVEIYHD
ncbi:MAG TPA: hypothetical protein PKX51_18205 [Cyclobacteriaceae bacterium]|nr:hypothetical protein [Cyclobacteriaceae bacterium]